MTLPDPEILDFLESHFVVGWRNIERETWCGLSHGYSSKQTALGTTNGAGGRNVQILVLAPDRTVLHALAGFWHPDDLEQELGFARLVFALHGDESRSREDKLRMYRAFHDQAIRRASPETLARSAWQSFDLSHEAWRVQESPRDTVRYVDGQPERDESGVVLLKPLNVLQHERMRSMPFTPYEHFDLERFVDYGLEHYDNNQWVDERSRRFAVREKLELEREQTRSERLSRVSR